MHMMTAGDGYGADAPAEKQRVLEDLRLAVTLLRDLEDKAKALGATQQELDALRQDVRGA